MIISTTKVALWTAALATLIILVVDPFFTGNAWWSVSKIGSDTVPVMVALAMPFTMWLPCVLIFGLMLKKHTHWLALSAIALMVLATAVVPGFINAMLLADTLHPDVSPAAGKTSIFFYIWHVLFLASIVLWTAHVARNWLARRPSPPRQA